jgi:hypothetical protein
MTQVPNRYNPKSTVQYCSVTPERENQLQDFTRYYTDDETIRVFVSEDTDTAKIYTIDALDDDQIPDNININSGNIIIVPAFTDITCPIPGVDLQDLRAILQFAECYHEGGHHLETATEVRIEEFEAFSKSYDDYPRPIQNAILKLAKDITGRLEDGAMEQAVIKSRPEHAGDYLQVKNEVFIAQSVSETPQHQRKKQTIVSATLLHLLTAKHNLVELYQLFNEEDPEWQFVDSEHREYYMNKVKPLANKSIQKALSEPQPATRMRMQFEQAKSIIDTLLDFGDDISDDQVEQVKSTQSPDRETDDFDPGRPQQPAQDPTQELGQNDPEDIAQQQANHQQSQVQVATPDIEQPPDDDESDSNEDTQPDPQQGKGQSQAEDSDSDNQSDSNQQPQEGQNPSSQQSSSQQTPDSNSQATDQEPGAQDTDKQQSNESDESDSATHSSEAESTESSLDQFDSERSSGQSEKTEGETTDTDSEGQDSPTDNPSGESTDTSEGDQEHGTSSSSSSPTETIEDGSDDIHSGNGSFDKEDSDDDCPSCGSTKFNPTTIKVDGLTAARAYCPIHPSEVDDIEFIYDDEKCGFRVTTSNPPLAKFENAGYHVVQTDVDTHEALTLRSNYGTTHEMEARECLQCSTKWIPSLTALEEQ